jgi:hypothetical protein
MLYKFGRSPHVIRCAPKLCLEGCQLQPKVLSTCHDWLGLQNVLPTFMHSCLVDSQISSRNDKGWTRDYTDEKHVHIRSKLILIGCFTTQRDWRSVQTNSLNWEGSSLHLVVKYVANNLSIKNPAVNRISATLHSWSYLHHKAPKAHRSSFLNYPDDPMSPWFLLFTIWTIWFPTENSLLPVLFFLLSLQGSPAPLWKFTRL